MLGSIKSKNDWCWFARGKHPVAKDFLSLGQDRPIFRAFSEWVEKGYQALFSKEEAQSSSCSWRFWARGPKRQALVCGLLKDSCDLLGRPHPLLVIGTGALGGWEDHWDLLPLACEVTWSHIEHLSAKKHRDIVQLKDSLQLSRPPNSEWKALVMVKEFQSSPNPSGVVQPCETDFRIIEDEAERLANVDDIIIPLKSELEQDLITAINLWHRQLKSRMPAPPNAVFMGGSPIQNYLVVFRKTLGQSDFSRLWAHCPWNKLS